MFEIILIIQQNVGEKATSPAVSQAVQEGKMVVVPKNAKKIASNPKPKPNPSKCLSVRWYRGWVGWRHERSKP